MRQFIKQMKNKLSLFNRGQDTPFFCSKSTKTLKNVSNELNNLFQHNCRNSISRNIKINTKDKTIPKFTTISKYDSNKDSFLLELKKISPMRSLKYQLELYEQKQRYGCHQNETILYTPQKKHISFLKDDFKKPYDYKPSLQKNYVTLKKQSCKGKFSSNYNKNKSMVIKSNLLKNNKGMYIKRPKSYTKPSTNFLRQKTNSSKGYSSINYSLPDKENTKSFINYSHQLKKKINKTIKQVNNASIELKQEIFYGKQYDDIFKLRIVSPKKSIKKNKSYININEINKEIKLNEKNKACAKRNMENRFKFLDKYSKKVIRNSINKVRNERRLLGKNEKGKYDDLHKRQALQKLKDDFKEIGKDILNVKKKYKGDFAIIPRSEVEFLHALIKENMWNDYNESEDLEQYITRSTIINRYLKSSKRKIAGRLAFLHQKSVNAKNRYLYNHS